MAYIRLSDNYYPLSERDIRAAFPNTSFAIPFNPDGYAVVFSTPQPTFDQYSQKCAEQPPQISVKGTWEQVWLVTDLTGEELEEAQQRKSEDDAIKEARIINELTAALEAHYDSVAAEKHYGAPTVPPRVMCALRAGMVGSPFQQEGVAFGAWMDTCNAIGYQIMAAVQAGQRAVPTTTEIVAELPEMVWDNI